MKYYRAYLFYQICNSSIGHSYIVGPLEHFFLGYCNDKSQFGLFSSFAPHCPNLSSSSLFAFCKNFLANWLPTFSSQHKTFSEMSKSHSLSSDQCKSFTKTMLCKNQVEIREVVKNKLKGAQGIVSFFPASLPGCKFSRMENSG